MYDDNTGQKPETVKYAPRTGPSAKERVKKLFNLTTVMEVKEDRASAHEFPGSNAPFPCQHHDEERHGSIETQEEEHVETPEETPKLSLPITLILLVVATAFIAFTAECLVDSINGFASGGGISKEFIGLILLPIVGNAAEHVSAITVSVKDKLTLSISIAVGSSIVSFLLPSWCCTINSLQSQQIALFVTPFTIILGWIIGRPLTMLFDPFESIVLFLTVSTVNYVVQDGKSNWLEGMILICSCV